MKSNNTYDAIIIGGGVAGLSTAMQLAKRGQKIVVLERERIGNGSTGRAAGLLGQLRGTAEHTRMLIDGVKVVKQLEEETGVEIFVQTGSLRVAENAERATEIDDLVAMGKELNFAIDFMEIDEVARRLPYMKTDDLIRACYCPTDGHLQPAELVAAYIKRGRRDGVEYVANSPVVEIQTDGGRARGVRTTSGEYAAPVVVNAAGPWSYLVAGLAEQNLPTAALGHFYLTTEPNAEHPVDRLSPALRNRHHRIYARPENGGLIVGMYADDTTTHDMAKLPSDFDMSAMKTRRDDIHVATLLHYAHQRYPWIDERTPMHVTTGIMTFTPDGHPFCGTLPGYEGLYHCSGFSGHGIVQSPTIGVIMADLILRGEIDYDIAAIEADRYFDLPGYQTRGDIEQKCYAMQGSYYGRVEGASATLEK